MSIINEFDDLREQLEPLVNSWKLKLDELWEKIRDVEDTNKRYSYIIECNRFKDLVSQMAFIKNDDIAVYTKEKKIRSIRHELHSENDDENVGIEVGDLISKIESELKYQPNMKNVVSNIRRSINLIKMGEYVIPRATKRELIDRLNKCIIARNNRVSHPTHGIVIQLKENRDFMHCIAAICHVQCQDCKHFMTFSGDTDCDIYAPIKCTKCKSFKLSHYHVTDREEFTKLDKIAEVVDEKTKSGTTRADQFRNWQQAFETPKKTKKTMCNVQ